MSSPTRLLVTFACVFVVAFTIQNRDIEDYLTNTFAAKAKTGAENFITGFIRNISFSIDERAILYIDGANFSASLDGSDFIDVTHLFPRSNHEELKQLENDFAMGTANGNVFALFKNGTDYVVMEADKNEFHLIHKPHKGFEISKERNGKHISEATEFVRKVNEAYTRLPH